MMLSTSAMQQLGKIVNPMTNKAEVSLEGAQVSIDMLNMLKEKTQGNLDAEEESMLNDVLASLQINYVETARSAPATDATPESKTQDAAEEPPAETAAEPEATVEAPADGKEPKFHKSYGE